MQATGIEERLVVGRRSLRGVDLVDQHGGVGGIHLRVRQAVVSLNAGNGRGEVARGATDPREARVLEGERAREPGLDGGLPGHATDSSRRDAVVHDLVHACPNARKGEIGEAEEIDDAADPTVADAEHHRHGGPAADAVGADAGLIDLGIGDERGGE